MTALAKALIVGAAAGVGYALIRGIRTAAAAEIEQPANGSEPTRPDLHAEPNHPSATPAPGPDNAPPSPTTGPSTPGPGSSSRPSAPGPGSSPPRPSAPGPGNSPPASRPTGPAPIITTGAGPQTPLIEPKPANRHQRINRSTFDVAAGAVRESPTELLTQARRYDPAVTYGELTGARLAASEHGSGSFTELACIVDSELNRALRRGQTLHASLTHRDTFGKQGKHRVASTRLDPQVRHLLAARAVLTGGARGVSRGAVRFFDPAAMESGYRNWQKWLRGEWRGDRKPSAITCDALGLLEAWSFDYGYHSKGRRCPPNRDKRGKDTLAWVGPIPGVDPYKLMLMTSMRPGPEHTRRYEAARAVIAQRLGKE